MSTGKPEQLQLKRKAKHGGPDNIQFHGLTPMGDDRD